MPTTQTASQRDTGASRSILNRKAGHDHDESVIADDLASVSCTRRTNRRIVRTWIGYVVVVAAYIVLGLFTKRFLTWTWGPIYFVVALEVLPRLIGRLRHALFGSRSVSGSAATSEAIVES